MKNLSTSRSKPVAIWLLVGVFMIIVQIVLGGITRLTDSGLSITEWKPIMGALPPMSEAEWQQAFEKYQQIAQYQHLHSYFTLEHFKSIFFWEWFHRLWGRLIGIVFAIPFLIFLVQKRFSKNMIQPMVILFLLGGLQGLIGWVMVMSGLNKEDLYVSHIRLSIHFMAAMGLLVYTFWFALRLLVPEKSQLAAPKLRSFSLAILALLVVQLVYGAFMAGLKAAMKAPTWPDINGEWLPSNLRSFAGQSYGLLSSLVNNPIAVHLVHRSLAYLLAVLVAIWTIKAARERGSRLFNTVKWTPMVLVLTQVVLGIFTVITSPQKVPQQWGVFEWNAQLHQFVAMLLLLSLVWSVYLLRKEKTAAVQPAKRSVEAAPAIP
jgi:cytochrome c oxidase assembly protein subunit 15